MCLTPFPKKDCKAYHPANEPTKISIFPLFHFPNIPTFQYSIFLPTLNVLDFIAQAGMGREHS